MANQRVDQVSNDVYGAKTLNNFLNPAAFAQPAAGGCGTSARNSIKGPSFHKVDLALSRLVFLAATRTIELRLEVFNLFNTVNWGLPNNDLATGTFGRITTITGDPRIMQFGIKYGF
jgi:trimeric autotransporter adhesin